MDVSHYAKFLAHLPIFNGLTNVEIEQFWLLVLHTAWIIDQGDKDRARTYIAAVKVQTPKIMQDVVGRAMHMHGSLGMSNEMPLMRMWTTGPIMGVVDGPTEVHRTTISKQVLKDRSPHPGLWPSEHVPARLEAARAKFAHVLELEIGNL